MQPEPDEDNYEKADAETMKAREWDEFVADNPRFELSFADCDLQSLTILFKRVWKYTKSWLSKPAFHDYYAQNYPELIRYIATTKAPETFC